MTITDTMTSESSTVLIKHDDNTSVKLLQNFYSKMSLEELQSHYDKLDDELKQEMEELKRLFERKKQLIQQVMKEKKQQ